MLLSQGAPPPPPPPLPPSLPFPGTNSRLCPMIAQESFLCKRCSNDEGSSQSEALKACRRLLLSSERTKLLSFNNRVLPVLQDGPSCGLAALCMAGQICNSRSARPPMFLSLNDALETARLREYSCRGEMFSAANMCALAKELLMCDVEILKDGFDQRERIIRHLMKGLPILVPYDADMNHEPCCRQGHKAHWAVLTGVVLEVPEEITSVLDAFTQDPSSPVLYHWNTNDDSCTNHCSCPEDVLSGNDRGEERVYFYAKQGKSCHIGLWQYEALARSNANLLEMNPCRRNSSENYILPSGGVLAGLCRQLLLIG